MKPRPSKSGSPLVAAVYGMRPIWPYALAAIMAVGSGCARERARPQRQSVSGAPVPPAARPLAPPQPNRVLQPEARPARKLPRLPTGRKLEAALRLPMRSRVAPLTMQYWGEKTPGPVLLDSLAERRLFSRFDQVKWHRWRADGSLVILNGERLYRVWPSGEAKLLAAVGRPHPDPRLSPDGRWVALALGQSVAFVPTDGGPVKRLPQPGWVHSIGWHPDSKRLALSAGNRIRVASISGTAQTLRVEQPTRPSAWWDGPATLHDVPQTEWSADGTRLAYRLLFRADDARDRDREAEIRILRGHKVEGVIGGYGACFEDIFSWALSETALAYSTNHGEPDTWCHLWTPRGGACVATSGTPFSYRHTAWQPHGHLLAVEERHHAPDELQESSGPVAAPSVLAFFAIEGIKQARLREDDWPAFEWAPSGRVFCAGDSYHYVGPYAESGWASDRPRVGDLATLGEPARGQLVQIGAMGPPLAEVQWAPGEREVSYVRQYERRNSGLFAAPLVRGRRGMAQARQWLASGKRLQHSRDIEEAAICFRNAVRCEPDWAEPRVRLARCYLELSRRESNPACTAWLLDGAEFEMTRAESLAKLSGESRCMRAMIAAHRESVNSALGVGSQRWWDRKITPQQPGWAKDPKMFGPSPF